MERRIITIGIAAILLLTSFAMTIQFVGGEETDIVTDPTEAAFDLQEPLDQGEAPDISGSLSHLGLSMENVKYSPNTEKMVSPDDPIVGARSYKNGYSSFDPPSRASDAEGEADQHDFPNGSKLSSAKETIDGTLRYDPEQGGSPDARDWYKFSVTDINEMANTLDGVRNVSVNLISYTDSSDGYTLFELTYDDSGMTSEFADLFEISLIYFDPWVGYVDMGNSEFWFDDKDDTDGWTYDGDNWTTGFVTPVNSDGVEDSDGYANGHTEEGWYYVGISFNFYIRDQTWNRDAFTIKYSLEIDTIKQEKTDQGSNAREDALEYTGEDIKHLSSRLNQVDWYKFEGEDQSKIWNITGTVTRHVGFGFADDPQFMDNWIWTFVVWRDAGEDDEWDTTDDRWVMDYLILSFFISGGRFASNAGQNINFSFASRDFDSTNRELYVGVVMEPVMVQIENGQIMGYYFYSPFPSWNNYTITHNIVEETPNTAPTLSDLEITSDWPGHESGGHYETEFSFNITYTDVDNDPPDEFNLVFQPYTLDENVIDMTMYEVDSGDTDYTDGKDYSYVATGEDLDEEYTPHIILVNASDTIPVESIRFRGFTGDIYYNNTLYVWDDEPVFVNPGYDGQEDMEEDVEDWFKLEGTVGLFIDPEQKFLGFQVWNDSADEWKTDYDSDLLHIKVEFRLGDGWVAVITPKMDQNGEETVSFRGFDEHSNATVDSLIIVGPVNDLPIVRSVEIDGSSYDVDNTRPEKPEIHLETEVTVTQDEEVVIGIILEDIDNEAADIDFSFVDRESDDWKGDIEVDENTGEITLTPNNDDIKRDNSEIVVSIDDGSGEIITLTLFLELTNKNDPPTIELDPAQKTTYEKDDEISIIPRISDPDPGASWTVSMNILDEIGGADPIVDQLPNAELVEDLDWTFNENIGRFTMKTDDWMIWWTSTGFKNSVTITIFLEVEDNGGLKDSVQIEMTLTTEGIPPLPGAEDLPTPTHTVDAPDYDVPGSYGLTVDLEVSGEVTTYYGEVMEPRWEYNGVLISSEEEFQYKFDSDGLKVIYLYYELGEETTEKKSYRLDLEEIIVRTRSPGPDITGGNGTIPVVAIVVIIIVVIVIILLVAIFFVMRKKKEPLAADQEHYDDQQQLGGRGSAPGLGAQARTQGLSPARETEHTEHLPPKRESAPEVSCPNCGASVQKGWFLCPECKNPLD